MSGRVITLCGSARFERHFKVWNKVLTYAGHAVFTLTSFPSDEGNKKDWYDPEDKARMDAAYQLKIARSDAVVVLNVFAYIGESALAEIEFARWHEKPVYAIESWGKGCGIGCGGCVHTDSYQRAAREAGCYGIPSPIDTHHPHMLSPICSDLLPESGALRSRLVAMIAGLDTWKDENT